MNRNLIGILSLVLMSTMINVRANAQAIAKANVPFAFRVGDAQLPAGTYLIDRVGAGSITVRSPEGVASGLTTARPEYPQTAASKLLFHHVGGQYFLAEIWRGAGNPGMAIPTSRLEKSLEKELRMASGRANVSEDVLIAMN